MWFVSISLMALWMACSLLGFTFFGFTHLLCFGAIVIELSRQRSRRHHRPTSH